MRPTEVQAAFGLAQLARLKGFTDARRKNYERIRAFFAKYEDHIILPQEEPGAEVNWLAFPLTIRKESPIDRNTLARYLEDRKIQTRPLFSGNIVKHPAYKGVGRSIGKLPASSQILTNSLLIGLHHGLTDQMLDYLLETLETFMQAKAR